MAASTKKPGDHSPGQTTLLRISLCRRFIEEWSCWSSRDTHSNLFIETEYFILEVLIDLGEVAQVNTMPKERLGQG